MNTWFRARPVACLILSVIPWAVQAQRDDLEPSRFNWQGFVSLNYSVSSNEVAFDRYIDDDGTLQASSIVGAQVNYALTQATQATAQVALARDVAGDRGLEPTVRWAYLSHHFGDGWRARLGRVRLNIYNNSENLEIGSTYAQATLPKEVYVNPGYLSADGVSLSKQFNLSEASNTEVGVNLGQRTLNFSLNSEFVAGDSDVDIANAYVTHEFDLNTSVFAGYLRFDTQFPTQFGIADSTGEIFSLSAMHEMGRVRFTGEYTALFVDTALSQGGAIVGTSDFESEGLAVLLERHWGANRPYFGLGVYELRSAGRANNLSSVRLGVGHQYNPSILLKAELLHLKTTSNPSDEFFNAPVGASQRANVLTLSYNWVF